MAGIVAVGTAVPEYSLDAAAFKAALARAFAPHADDLRPLLRMADRCGVQRRFVAAPVEALLVPRTLSETSQRYAALATELGERACRDALERARVRPIDVDVVVSVSCTGYMLPSLDAHLVQRLGLRHDVCRLPITELGCLAGAAGIARTRNLLLGGAGETALIVAAEFPSLTFQPGDGSMDNLVSTLVFGDGAGAAVLKAGSVSGFELVATRSCIAPDSLEQMAFELRDGGFHVVLSKEVPRLLAGPFAEAATALLDDHGLSARDLTFACIHPGGPKILQAVDAALGVEGLTAPSWHVLERYGNQSSAAVFFILAELLAAPPPAGSFGLLAGFGPGLSLELGLLRRA